MQGLNEGMKGLKAQMSNMPGMMDTGASAEAMADYYNQGVLNMNKAIADPMYASSEAERNRQLQQILGKWQMQGGIQQAEIGASGQAAAANASANASTQNAWLDYLLGQGQLGLGYQQAQNQFDLGQGNLGLGYYQTDMGQFNNMLNNMYQNSPESIWSQLAMVLGGFANPVVNYPAPTTSTKP